jgi:glutathione S-transferase
MLDVASGSFRNRIGRLFFNTVVGPKFFGVSKATPEEKQEYLDDVFEAYSMLEGILSNSEGKYVLGDDLTLADIYFWIFTMTASTSTDAKITKYAELQRWYKDIESIPEVARVLKRRNKLFKLAMFYANWILPLSCRKKKNKKEKL